MGKGGGGGGAPQTTTAYQTNLPEYAKPYVMNMLGAAQNQLFETTGGEITGFRPYTPYSTDPTKYFAGPSSLQQQGYQEAAGMTTPGQFAPATGLATAAGIGQLGTAQQAQGLGAAGMGIGQLGMAGAMPAFGAGQQYAQQVTSPSSMAAYMSPYQQQVTDVAKAAAIREAQMADKANRLSAARQGTYGGARETLGRLERERNLLSNLSNIQAQGSQSAYDKAMQAQQFGANLGLQGIQTGLQGIGVGQQGVSQGLAGLGAQQAAYSGAGQLAGQLGSLGTAEQAADISRIGLQQQLGQAQQQYQQNIINQAIQDYATAQQYPYMQLSTMSNLLRGLPMQSMSTQQYQAQPSTLQQGLGLLGTGASLYGAFGKRAGGEIKEYRAGGGIKAYDVGGSVDADIDDIAEAGGIKGLERLLAQTKSPEARKRVMARMREMGIAAAPTGKLGTNLAGGGIVAFGGGGDVPGYYDGDLIDGFGMSPEAMAMDQLRVDEAKLLEDRKRYEQIKAMSPVAAEKMLRENPNLEVRAPVVAATPAAEKKDNVAPAAAPAAAPASATQAYTAPTGLAAVLAERKKLMGLDDVGEKSSAFMKALEERQAGLGKQNETDRYLRMAEAFSKFGSTAGPIGKTAAEALGGFAKGEAAARKDQDKMQLEGMKMQADLEKARRAEIRGDFESAEKFYSSAEDRKNRLDAANISAGATGQAARFEKEAIERVMKDKGVDFATALQMVRGAGRSESVDMQIAKSAYTAAQSSVAPGGPNAKKYKELMKEDPSGAAAEEFVQRLAQKQIQGMKTTMGLTSSNVQLDDKQRALLDKYK